MSAKAARCATPARAAARARGLRDTCVAWFPAPARPLVPLLDGVARRWLTRSQSPYVEEVRTIAATLGFPGIWFLNGSYQWSCTALGREEDGVPWLARTLDWPFPGLGRYVEIARMQGAGRRVLQRHLAGLCRRADRAGAGPLRRLRSTRRRCAAGRHGRFLRLVRSGRQRAVDARFAQRSIPPDQLLRHVFEEAARLCRGEADARDDADRAAGDLYARRLPQRASAA